MSKSKPEPVSPSNRVRASEARKIEGGGRRMPGVIMPADAAEALKRLEAGGYGDSTSGCIFRAIIEADERMQEVEKRLSLGPKK